MRQANAGPADRRVAVAAIDTTEEPAALLTYAIEIRAGPRAVLRQVIAVRVARSGASVLSHKPEDWLRTAARGHDTAPNTVWQSWFADWLPARRAEADAVAAAAMARMSATFAESCRVRAERDDATLRRWLAALAERLCGPPLAQAADLFGAPPAAPAWKILRDAPERLAAYAVDTDNPMLRREEARSSLALFRARTSAGECPLQAHMTPLGLLLLIPRGTQRASARRGGAIRPEQRRFTPPRRHSDPHA